VGGDWKTVAKMGEGGQCEGEGTRMIWYIYNMKICCTFFVCGQIGRVFMVCPTLVEKDEVKKFSYMLLT
jgi:hypothetical protein